MIGYSCASNEQQKLCSDSWLFNTNVLMCVLNFFCERVASLMIFMYIIEYHLTALAGLPMIIYHIHEICLSVLFHQEPDYWATYASTSDRSIAGTHRMPTIRLLTLWTIEFPFQGNWTSIPRTIRKECAHPFSARNNCNSNVSLLTIDFLTKHAFYILWPHKWRWNIS